MMFFLIARSAFLAIPFYFLWNYFAPIYGHGCRTHRRHFRGDYAAEYSGAKFKAW